MSTTHFDTMIIGAGISGISAAHYMRVDCPTKTFAILEGRKAFGGTWDLFRYPGIRSDSDMYTFGFAFKPWSSKNTIAPREEIMTYLSEVITEEKLDKHILFEHRLKSASWDSATSLWTLRVKIPASDTLTEFTCNIMSLCVGYYDYDKGYLPKFKGLDVFKGQVIHPQKWPKGLAYANKKVIVIGSGATAITLVPKIAETAKRVTLLQRSPSYLVNQATVDEFANFINRILPEKTAYMFNRWRKIASQRFTAIVRRKYPKIISKIIIDDIRKEVGDVINVDKHFRPRHKPSEQRVAVITNGDFFEGIRKKKIIVVTDTIDSFTEKGVLLTSGETLEADVIVTATGLVGRLFDRIRVEVDGERINFSKRIVYKSVMIEGVPNLTYAFGYVNASWTLKCDLSSQYTCRLINYMDKNGHKKVVPVSDVEMELKPFLDEFTPGYITRTIDGLLRKGDRFPWLVEQNYYLDRKILTKGAINDGFMQFD